MNNSAYRVLGGVMLALWWAGCGASGDDSSKQSSGHDPYGGQTGSLVPPSCGVAPNSARFSVPASDNAVVLHTSACSDLTGFELRGPDGTSVPYFLDELDGGAHLLRTDSVLEPGRYTVVTPAGTSESFSVVQSAPLPARIGTVEVDGDRTCTPEIVVRLAPEVLQYVALLSLEYSVDDGDPVVVAGPGALDVDDGVVRFSLANCKNCLPGQHTLIVSGVIAGESAQPDPASVSLFRDECFDPTPAGCSLAPRRAHGGGAAALFALLALALARTRRR